MPVPEGDGRDETSDSDETVSESIKEGVEDILDGNIADAEDVKEAFQSD